mmetsp:Transcript_16328/g.14248  ORF Transcript_16328/g.14248 Transcript_16328/m.14248 type:complete len:145 (+) Transcript_16328:306-740(+)
MLSSIELTRKKDVLQDIKSRYQLVKEEQKEEITSEQIIINKRKTIQEQKEAMMKKLNHKEARDSNIQYIWTTISFISCQVKIELMNSKALCVYTIYPKYCSKSFSHKVKGLETRKDPILILPSLHFKIKALIGKYKEGPKYENE